MDEITKDMIKQLMARLEHISNPQHVRENDPTPHAEREPDVEARHGDPLIPRSPGVPTTPPAVTHHCITYQPKKDWRDKTKFWFEIGGILLLGLYTVYTIKMYWSNRDAANAAQGANEIARSALTASQRPWVKIKHRIIVPLTFNVERNGGPMAMMTLEDTVENIGQSVAVGELQWEELIPIDRDFSIRTARARQAQYCDANRHPATAGVSGYALFPHDPAASLSTVGVPMSKALATQIHDGSALNGTVGGFVLVGCVYYRASFEPTTEPTHQTRFIYYLGTVDQGGMLPNVLPQGVANKLRLIEAPDSVIID